MSNAAVRWVQTEEEHRRVRMPDALADRQSTRFIWQAREDVPHAEVLGGVIERCRVMPVIRLLRWDRIEDIPLEHREPGMVRKDNEGKTAYAAYPILPGYICDAILDQYRNRGVIELTALKGTDASQFKALNIDGLFFPERKSVDDGVDETPQTYAEMRRAIASAIDAVRANGLGYSAEKFVELRTNAAEMLAKLETCAQEMLRAITLAERYDMALVDESEGEMELGRTNPHYKQKYDAADLAALKRVGRPRKDAFMKRLADQQVDLQATVREAIIEKGQAASAQEIAQAVGSSVAAEMAKIFAAQRAIPLDQPAGEAEQSSTQTPEPTKPSPQTKPPKFQQTK